MSAKQAKTPETAPLRALVRARRSSQLRSPLADDAAGLSRRRTSAAGRSSASSTPGPRLNSCHAHFRERAQDVKRGVAQAGGFARGDAGAVGGRELHQADLDALPQHAGDGDRGDDPLAPARRRGADGRLRQDHARPRHGRDHRRRAVDLPARRPDAARATTPARSWAPARTPGSTGTSGAPATSRDAEWLGVQGGIARSVGTCMTMGTAVDHDGDRRCAWG